MKSIIEDQYTAAQAYFLCVIGLLFFESSLRLPSYLLALRHRGHTPVKSSPKHCTVYTYFHKLAILPSIIPLITNHRLPNLLRLATFTGLNILWGWNSNEFTTDYKLYGWLTIANGGLGFLLAARSNVFALVVRIPSTTLLMYHRWIGRATVIHATIHFALNIRHNIETEQLATVLSNRRIQVGIMAWVSLGVIAITSISLVRRRFFEVFYYSHFLFILFAVGALIHASKGPEFLLPGIGLWLIDRFIRFIYNFRALNIIAITPYAGDVTKFKIHGITTTLPGQIAWIQLPGVSFLNWHPFTIASAPGDDLVIAVRSLGGFTQKAQRLEKFSPESQTSGIIQDSRISSDHLNQEKIGSQKCGPASPVKMRIDGPYGVGSTQWGQHPVTVLVAGGIGITPGISIAAHIINCAKKDLSSGKEVGSYRHLHLLWIIKKYSHARWFEEELSRLADQAKSPELKVTVDVTIHVTESTTATDHSEESVGMHGRFEYIGPGVVVPERPNLEAWFADVKAQRIGMDSAVSVCGPRSLIGDVRKAASKASWNGTLFHVEEEVFEL